VGPPPVVLAPTRTEILVAYPLASLPPNTIAVSLIAAA